MSFRLAVNAKRRSRTNDPRDVATAAQQIVCCVVADCHLHPHRPITTKAIPLELLDSYRPSPEKLDDRARVLVTPKKKFSGESQNEPLAKTELKPDRGMDE